MGGECGTERPNVGIAGQTTHFTVNHSRLSHQFAVGMRSPYHSWIPDTGTAETFGLLTQRPIYIPHHYS